MHLVAHFQKTYLKWWAVSWQAILSGLKSSRYQHHVIVTETYRYWIFELLRQLRSYHVQLDFSFQVLQDSPQDNPATPKINQQFFLLQLQMRFSVLILYCMICRKL